MKEMPTQDELLDVLDEQKIAESHYRQMGATAIADYLREQNKRGEREILRMSKTLPATAQPQPKKEGA